MSKFKVGDKVVNKLNIGVVILAPDEHLGDVLVAFGGDLQFYYYDKDLEIVSSAAPEVDALRAQCAAAETQAARAEAALLALVNDMRGVDFYYVPTDLQRQVHEAVPQNRQVAGRPASDGRGDDGETGGRR